MTEDELLYFFPYAIDKQRSFKRFVSDNKAFIRRFAPHYDGKNVREFLYERSGIGLNEIYEIEYLYEHFSRWSEWYSNGRNIFSFSEDLLSMLEKTDVSNITPDMFHLPYDIFYISLRPLNIKIAKDRPEIIEGVYIDHNVWNPMGEHPEGYCDLSMYFVGDFKEIYFHYVPNVKSRLEWNIHKPGDYDVNPIGSFWNIWLWFEKSKGRETVKQTVDHFLTDLKSEIFPKPNADYEVTDYDLDFYNSSVDLVQNTINLVINCLLYLSQPNEKKDIETKYPKGLPNNFDKKFSFAKTSREIEKVNKNIEDLGFTKINYVGKSFKRANKEKENESYIQPHWRRGHWRNQKYGENRMDSRMIWIMPTIVNKSADTVLKGHLYDVKQMH